MPAFPNLRRMLAFLGPYRKWIALSQVLQVLIPDQLSLLDDQVYTLPPCMKVRP